MTTTKRMSDEEAQRFYEDPANLEPPGRQGAFPGGS